MSKIEKIPVEYAAVSEDSKLSGPSFATFFPGRHFINLSRPPFSVPVTLLSLLSWVRAWALEQTKTSLTFMGIIHFPSYKEMLIGGGFLPFGIWGKSYSYHGHDKNEILEYPGKSDQETGIIL